MSASSFSTFINEQLNPAQRDAVTQKDGVLLVCAGAGSGKTRVITARIAHLIHLHHVDASAILAVTFTNKAAREMRERVAHFVGAGSTLPIVGTFHGFCVRMLKQYAARNDQPAFTIIDGDDQEKLINTILTNHGARKRLSPRAALGAISNIRNEMGLAASPALCSDPFLRQVWTEYTHEKEKAHYYDFDDLLVETLRIFTTDTVFRTAFQQRVRHVLVDEYQDTNTVQHALLKAIACDTHGKFSLDSLCVVGDEDQSIYSWRGATVENIVGFAQEFDQTRRITINQNYRSVQPILEAANAVIAHNTTRYPKDLWSDKPARNRILSVACASGYQEADLIAQCSRIARQEHQQSCAILYRSHHQSRPIEEALLRLGLPYVMIGGVQFYERQEIKDVIAYLRLVVNPFDRISVLRVANVPTRGLGDKFIEQFFEVWDREPLMTYRNVAHHLINNGDVTGLKAGAVKQFLAVTEGLTPQTSPEKALDHILEKTSYFAYLATSNEPDEARVRTENVQELRNAIVDGQARMGAKTLSEFLEEVALFQDAAQERDTSEQHVVLMTLHAAKGLEFDTVILAGLDEGIFPSSHALYNPSSLEEERRLMYVGITRARERLILTHAQYRWIYGSMVDQKTSRFVEEIPEKLKQEIHVGKTGVSRTTDQLISWFGTTASRHAVHPPRHTTPGVSKIANEPHQAAPHIEKTTAPARWRVAQRVVHPQFGVGVVEAVEGGSDANTRLTIKFGSSKKKLDARFVTRP